MKKEALFAIFFGILLGLGVAVFMVWRIRGTESPAKQIASVSPTPAVRKETGIVDNTLQIKSPANGAIVKSNSITLKGAVQKHSTVIVQSPLTEKVVKITKDTFDIPFTLAVGENIILVAAYPDDKTVRPQQKTITVYYLKENE